jgi:hypothetical protein
MCLPWRSEAKRFSLCLGLGTAFRRTLSDSYSMSIVLVQGSQDWRRQELRIL